MINSMGSIIAEIQRIQQELKGMAIEVNEGGTFKVVMNGYQEVLEVAFSPDALRPENVEALQVMVASVFNRVLAESKNMIKNEVAKVTEGMGLPGFTGLF